MRAMRGGGLPCTHYIRGGVLVAYDKSAELDEYNERVHVRRADLLAAAGRAAEALAACDAAMDIDPRYADAHFRKAALLRTVGLYYGSLYYYGRAIELDPGHFGALTGMGDIRKYIGGRAGPPPAVAHQ